jgi:rod shape-determining protein MreD
VRALVVLLILAIGIILQTTFARFFVARMNVDFVLVAVVYVALSYGPVAGLLSGTAAGLAQDALSGGILGIGGLAKTIVGFLTGIIGAQFIVSSALPRFVMFFMASVVHAACFMGIYALRPDARATAVPYGQIALQALGNAAIGLLSFQAVEGLPGMVQRRRISRAYGRRRV